MGVYIPNMEKPKSCDECWALDDKYDYPMCLITQEQRGYDFNTMTRVMDDCPLIEIDDTVWENEKYKLIWMTNEARFNKAMAERRTDENIKNQ